MSKQITKSAIEIRIKKESPAWRTWDKILKKWVKVHKIYTNESNDLAYRYNERASLSMLAAAVWLSNGVAIEEYKSEKIDHDNKKYKGRVDLWFQLNNYYTAVESKQINKRVVKKNISLISHEINDKLNEARNDARKSMHRELKGFAVVFFTPNYYANKPIDFSEIIEQVNKTKCDFYAYIQSNNDPKQKIISPGGFIIGKRVNKNYH